MLRTKVETPEYFGEVCPISVVNEIPEQLHELAVQFTENSDWSYNDLVQESLVLFLLAQKKGDRIETIVCPECGSHEVSTIGTTEIFDDYFHCCSICEQIITESDWEKV